MRSYGLTRLTIAIWKRISPSASRMHIPHPLNTREFQTAIRYVKEEHHGIESEVGWDFAIIRNFQLSLSTSAGYAMPEVTFNLAAVTFSSTPYITLTPRR